MSDSAKLHQAKQDVMNAAQDTLEALRFISVQMQSGDPPHKIFDEAIDAAFRFEMNLDEYAQVLWEEQDMPIPAPVPDTVRQLRAANRPIWEELMEVIERGYLYSDNDTDLLYLGTHVLSLSQQLLGPFDPLPGFIGFPPMT